MKTTGSFWGIHFLREEEPEWPLSPSSKAQLPTSEDTEKLLVATCLRQLIAEQIKRHNTTAAQRDFIFHAELERFLRDCLAAAKQSPAICEQFRLNKKSKKIDQIALFNAIIHQFPAFLATSQEAKQQFIQQYHISRHAESFANQSARWFGFIMRSLVSICAALIAYLCIAILIPPPVGIGLGIFGAITNLGMNFVLLKINSQKVSELRLANNVGKLDNFLYGANLFNSSLAWMERGIKNFSSTLSMLHHYDKIPFLAELLIAAIVTAEVLYFYARTLANFVYKRFSRQEQIRQIKQRRWWSWLTRKQIFQLEKKELRSTPTQPTVATVTPNSAIQPNQQASSEATQLLFDNLQRISHELNVTDATTLLNISPDLQHAVIEALLSQSEQNLRDPKLSPNQKLEAASKLLKMQKMPFSPDAFEAWLEQTIINRHAEQSLLVNRMAQVYQARNQPNTFEDLERFFNEMANDLFDYYQQKEQTINELLTNRSLRDLVSSQCPYKRPRRTELHNEIVHLFADCFLDIDASRKEAFIKTYGKVPATTKQYQREDRWNKFKSMLAALIGNILPAIAIASLIPAPFGFVAAAICYLCFATINYHFIYKQNTDQLAVKIDENLEIKNPSLARKRAIQFSLLIHIVGNSTASTKVFYQLASKVLSIPKVGLILFSTVVAAASLYRVVTFTYDQIKKLFANKEALPANKTLPLRSKLSQQEQAELSKQTTTPSTTKAITYPELPKPTSDLTASTLSQWKPTRYNSKSEGTLLNSNHTHSNEIRSKLLLTFWSQHQTRSSTPADSSHSKCQQTTFEMPPSPQKPVFTDTTSHQRGAVLSPFPS